MAKKKEDVSSINSGNIITASGNNNKIIVNNNESKNSRKQSSKKSTPEKAKPNWIIKIVLGAILAFALPYIWAFVVKFYKGEKGKPDTVHTDIPAIRPNK